MDWTPCTDVTSTVMGISTLVGLVVSIPGLILFFRNASLHMENQALDKRIIKFGVDLTKAMIQASRKQRR